MLNNERKSNESSIEFFSYFNLIYNVINEIKKGVGWQGEISKPKVGIN